MTELETQHSPQPIAPWRRHALPVTTWLVVLGALMVIVAEGIFLIPQIAASGGSQAGMPAPAPQLVFAPPPATAGGAPVKAGDRGLLLSVYKGLSFEQPLFTRIYEGEIKFALDHQLGPGADASSMSLMLSGMLRVPRPGEYRFTVYGDDAVRITVNGQRVIDSWPTRETIPGLLLSPVRLPGGNVPVMIEVTNGVGPGWIGIEWEGPGLSKRYLNGNDFVPSVVQVPSK